jgi:hypothetical protein
MKTFKQLKEDLNNPVDEKTIEEAINYHIDNGIPFAESVFRLHSESFYRFFRFAKQQYQKGLFENLNEFDEELLQTDIGEFAIYDGENVPLDIPIQIQEEDEKNPPLGKPKTGGPKKYYVFVKDPSTGNIKKVTWGDTTGLKNKMNDPEARKSFAARHKCSQQKDRTTAAYWACNTPRYAKSLGLSGGGSFYW